MKKRIKRGLSCLIAGILAFSSLTTSFAAGAAGGAVIDLSHENPNGWGASFGIAADAVSRWQTFTATQDGILDTAEVYLIKINPDKGAHRDVIASIYPMENGVKAGEALQTVTIPVAQVKDQAVTAIDFNVPVEKEKQYALSLTTDEPGIQDNDHPRYDWANKDIGLDAANPSGKIVPGGDWVTETQWVHTYWTKLYYGQDREPTPPIDYTFEGDRTWGFTFGCGGEAHRYQTFTPTVSDRMTSFEVYLCKKNQATLSFPNVIAALYDTVDGKPANQLTTVTKLSGELPDCGVSKFNLSYQLEAGKQYAIVMTIDQLGEDNGKDPCYGWPTSDKGLAGKQFYGKMGPAGEIVDESNLGTGYLKVHFDQEEQPDEPKPTTVKLTANNTILALDGITKVIAEVKDQFGQTMEGQTIVYSSDRPAVADVDQAGTVTAKAPGVAKITAACGAVSDSVSVTVKDASGQIEPVPGMVITEDVKFKPGAYDFGGANKGITIQGDNLTVDGTDVRIFNAADEDILADVTSGTFAYRLNPAEGKSAYCLTREFDFRKAQEVTLRFDSKTSGTFVGTLKVYASENGGDWTELANVVAGSSWNKTTLDLREYAGKKVSLRIAYENTSSTMEEMTAMGLKLDTFEVFEDGVRTFSDLCGGKVFYLWDVSYGDEAPIDAPNVRNKPFDRTEYTVDTSLFKATGITIRDSKNVTVKGFDVSGFYYAMEASNCSGLTIQDNNFSDNYTNPNGGWGDQLGGAMVLEHVSGSTIQNNRASNNANGLYLRYSGDNVITGNHFSVCSDVCLELWNSSYNRIEDNDFSWGIRIDPYEEVHARDSTSSLIEAASNYNYVKNNDFTHGGDGIFIRALNGMVSEGNVFESNDTSFANNNAVESGMGRNYWINNKANWSSYGFWMGGSDESVMIGNEIAFNGIKPANAPENYGNAGISMTGWSSEHMVIVDNDIHDNNGSGIAMRYRENQPSFNGLIQNNRIVNNSKYAIYLEKAKWFEINGNLIEGNGEGDEVYLANNTSDIFQRSGAVYQEEYQDYQNLVPSASIECNPKERFQTGEEVTFSAAKSTDPNGKPLSYRWEMGDGTVLTGETIRYSFQQPGFYDVAVSATNGAWTDIAWVSVNVVAAGEEMGTETLADWEVTDNGGKTELSLQDPNMDIPKVGGTDWVEHPIYYVVDGEKSIKLTSTSPNNTLTYPKTKDAGFDFSKEYAFGFSMKLRNQNNRNGGNTPIVTLYTDENNYLTYTPSNPLMFPHAYETFTEMQYRHEWYPVNIPLEGNGDWVCAKTGAPDLSSINYITIHTNSGGSQPLELWIDGMKTISKDTLPYYGANVAADGQEIHSSMAEDSHAGIHQKADPDNRWISQVEKESFYGVTFATPRILNQVSFYAYFQPTGLEGDFIGLPSAYEIQYLNKGEWRPVKQELAATAVKPGENIVKFDLLSTTGIRVLLKNAEGSAAALYGFQAVNSRNIAGEKNTLGKAVPTIASSINRDAVVSSIELYIAVCDVDMPADMYSDYLVFLYETAPDGRAPVGAPIGKGILPYDTIKANGPAKIYTIPITDMDGGELVLKAGVRYALGATQDKRIMPNNHCYRWPTNGNIGVTGEHFGTMNFDSSEGTFNGFGNESHLGTGWMRVHTDKDVDGKATIDYTWEIPAGANPGYGVGCAPGKGEIGRYQTFTLPVDDVLNTVDGKVNDADGWLTQGNHATDELSYTFAESQTLQNALIFLEGVPEKMVLRADGTVIAEKGKAELQNGVNVVPLHSVAGKTFQIEITNGADSVLVKEVELMNAAVPAVETVDKSELEAFIQKAESLHEQDYTAESWAAFQEALTHAKAVKENPNVTQTDVNRAFNQLVAAQIDLDQKASGSSKVELQTLLEEAAKLNLENCRPGKAEALKKAVEEAERIMEKQDAGQKEVNDAADALLEAIVNLKEIVDRSDLNDLLTILSILKAEDYTAESFAVLTQAMEAAKRLNDDSSVKEVTDAHRALQQAYLQLERVPAKPSKSALENAIKNAKRILDEIDSYKPNSVVGLEEALKKAQAVYENPNATKEEIDLTTKELSKANAKAQVKEDKTVLLKAIRQAEEVDAALFTADSFADLTRALAQARLIAGDDNASKEQVASAAEGVERALAGLQKISGGGDSSKPSDGSNGGTSNSATGDNRMLLPFFATGMLALGCVLGLSWKRKQTK